jgi:hypothetical protein
MYSLPIPPLGSRNRRIGKSAMGSALPLLDFTACDAFALLAKNGNELTAARSNRVLLLVSLALFEVARSLSSLFGVACRQEDMEVGGAGMNAPAGERASRAMDMDDVIMML